MLKKAEDLLFPRKCPLCSEIIPFGETNCKNCQDNNRSFVPDNLCLRCHKNISDCVCTDSEITEIPYLTSVYYYCDSVRSALIEFKFRGNKFHAEFFGNKLAEKVAVKYPTVDFDLVTFAPMSKKSLKKRGYNQSELLAKVVAKRLFIPCRRTLIKTKETRAQHDLDFNDRQTNLLGSMVATDKPTDITGKTILLVDDIKTTGATLRECIKTLKAKGAKEVYCVTVALVYINDDLFT